MGRTELYTNLIFSIHQFLFCKFHCEFKELLETFEYSINNSATEKHEIKAAY